MKKTSTVQLVRNATLKIRYADLSYNVKESDLRHVMEEYGTVASVKLITDRETRRSKGFASVSYTHLDVYKRQASLWVNAGHHMLDSPVFSCSIHRLKDNQD